MTEVRGGARHHAVSTHAWRDWRSWLAWGIVVGCLSLAAWQFGKWMAPSRATMQFVHSGGMRAAEMRKTRAERMEALTWVPAGDETRLGDAIETAIDDSHGVLVGAMRQRLGDTIRAHVAARTSPDPMAYLRLADSEQTRWIGPGDDDNVWRLPGEYYELVTGRAIKRTEARAALALFLRWMWDGGEGRIASIGIGDWGLTIQVDRTREVCAAVPARFVTPEQGEYWEATSTVAVARYRVPRRSYADVLAQNQSVTVAVAGIPARTLAGQAYLIVSRWYWDPQLGAWHCAEFNLKQGRHANWF